MNTLKQPHRLSTNYLVITLLCLTIIATGAGTAKFLIANRKAPKKVDQPAQGALVETLTATSGKALIQIPATGTVVPREHISLTPRVSGTVEKIHPLFRAGGFIKKDEILFEIEETDYRYALKNAEAGLAKAELDLLSVQGKAEVARREWERLGEKRGPEPSALLLYGPQLKNAEAGRDAALATVQQAKLNLTRTKVRAPFNCLVRSEQVDVGQFVSSNSVVGSLVATDAVEIITSLRLDDRRWLEIPHTEKEGPGSEALVRLIVDDQRYLWHGFIARSLGEVDSKGRMMQVAVVVKDPYNLAASSLNPPTPLALGMFVELEFQGSVLDNVVTLPRKVLRDNSSIWLMDEQAKLRIRPVEIARFQRDEIIIASGLTGGERVVVTTLSGAADGMSLRGIKEKM